MMRHFDFSQRKACRLAGVSVSMYRYEPNTARDDEVIAGLQKAVEKYPAYGFGKLFKVLRRREHPWNHKWVHRVYCLLNLNKRRRGKKRLPSRKPVQVATPLTINGCWSMDFMSDGLFCGRRFRTFNIVDDYSREALAIEVDIGLPSAKVVHVLERIVASRGYPSKIRVDNVLIASTF